ncbi:MSMEG_0570 family nitrogen starvation response protein [Duganella sp. FT94W]|uniref:MSMEG_0570 family nitrogen starvation response protein n=1 Tax=Duganella lactea TaxID=2692173 RepID=A0ABW9V6L4_9BURK|nr:MSMEG_0570 family nitrogen starvation response protein [Duganella lactea]MYM33287.1 MSMEG_0570 family nitrogen starvation response protein [Duganella lactea]
MPEVRFTVRWPDDSVSDCYSPSTVIHDYLQAGASYPLDDFMTRSRTALHLASERVRLKYGYACSSAMDQLLRLEARAVSYQAHSAATVTIVALQP